MTDIPLLEGLRTLRGWMPKAGSIAGLAHPLNLAANLVSTSYPYTKDNAESANSRHQKRLQYQAAIRDAVPLDPSSKTVDGVMDRHNLRAPISLGDIRNALGFQPDKQFPASPAGAEQFGPGINGDEKQFGPAAGFGPSFQPQPQAAPGVPLPQPRPPGAPQPPWDPSMIPGYNPNVSNIADPSQLPDPQALQARQVADGNGGFMNDFYNKKPWTLFDAPGA